MNLKFRAENIDSSEVVEGYLTKYKGGWTGKSGYAIQEGNCEKINIVNPQTLEITFNGTDWYKVEEAEEKLSKKTYGECSECDEPITVENKHLLCFRCLEENNLL